MPKKKRHEFSYVKESVERLGYTLLDKVYTNINTKISLIDNEGYYYYVIFSSIKNNFVPNKFHKSNIYTKRNIKLWLLINNKPFKLIETQEYKSNSDKLKWQCLKENCGGIFESSWNAIKSGQGCGICYGKQVHISNCLATLNPELAKEWHPTKNGNLTPYDVTCGCNMRVWWKCFKNHEWIANINSRNKRRCPYCSHSLPSDDYNLLLSNPNLCAEWDYKKNNKNPEEYCPNSDQYVWWKCMECNHEWNARINERNSKKDATGCPECSKSKGEKKCSEFLCLNRIYYIAQKEFDGLLGLGNGLLSYDFYLPKYNLLIEYQGEYHDRPVKYKNETIKESEDRFNTQKEHDRRKKEYALKNRYNFLEIWYWDFDNIEEILDNYFKKVI